MIKAIEELIEKIQEERLNKKIQEIVERCEKKSKINKSTESSFSK